MKISLIFLFILVFGFLGFGYMHEQVHVAIYKGYGIESNVEMFSHFPDFVTISEEGCPTEECQLAHNINEAVTYPLGIFYFVFGFAIFIVICFLEIILDIKIGEIKLREEKTNGK